MRRVTALVLLAMLALVAPAAAAPPAVTAGAKTTTTADGAKLAGVVQTGGLAGTAVFKYGTSPGALTQSSAPQALTASSTAQDVTAELTGLGDAPLYYALSATTGGPSGGTAQSATQVAFRAPTLATAEATEVTQTQATLNGTVALRGAPSAKVQFVYGKKETAEQTITADGTVRAEVDGLTPRTTYRFKLRVTRGTEVFETGLASFATGAPATGTPDPTDPTVAPPKPTFSLKVPKGRKRGSLFLRRRTLTVRVRCGDSPCRATASGVVRVGKRLLGRLPAPAKPLRLGARERGTIVLRSTKAFRKRVRVQLRRQPKRRVVLTLRAAFRDEDGDRIRRTVRVRLRR